MSKFGLKNIWNIKTSGGSNVDTTNLAKTNEANTFTGKNTFKDTGDILTIQTTDNTSGGLDFKQSNNTRIGYLGGSQTSPDKITLWGKNGLILQANGQNVEVNSGAGLLKYTTSNTSKDRQEVLVRNDLYYVQKVNVGSFNIPANGYQTAEYTINGITGQTLHEFYIELTTNNVDIGFAMKIYVNNPNYPNQSDIHIISTSNWSNQNLDNLGTVQIGFILHSNNKIRFRAKNLHNQQITFNAFRVFHRVPGGTVR